MDRPLKKSYTYYDSVLLCFTKIFMIQFNTKAYSITNVSRKDHCSRIFLVMYSLFRKCRCKRAPVTCSIVKSEPAAVGCRRGQVKFSSMEAGTHVRPHVGPTNCRLRMHLALSNTKDTYIRVDQEIR